MIDFPNHDALIAKAHEALHSQFEFSERVFNYWIGQEKNKYLWRGHLDELVVNVGATLDVQACRQFRTVIDLCQRCEGYDASVIARSLFETSLAMLFVLTEKLYLQVEPVRNKPNAWRAAPSQKGRRRKRDLLTQSHRAALYMVNIALQDEVKHGRLSATRGRKGYAKIIKPDPAIIAECEKLVGPEWTYILRNPPRSYSGLSISDLARGLAKPLGTYYDTIYHYQAKMSHASDAIRHVAESDDGGFRPQWLSPINEISAALQAGTASFQVCLGALQRGIDFGGSNGRILSAFAKEFNEAFDSPWPP